MDVTRRKFLKLSGMTISGTFLGGVPFLNSCKTKPHKLKRTIEVTTICPYCSVGCGLVVAVRDGVVVNIEGDPDHPINRGSLCAKGIALYQATTLNDMRPKGVLYRAPYSTRWREISWDAAIKKIANRIKRTRDKTFLEKEDNFIVNRTAGITGFSGTALTNEECYAWTKFARILGITYLENQGIRGYSATVEGMENAFGHGVMTNHWIDIQHADVIMMIRSNPAEDFPVSFKYIMKAKGGDARLLSIDSRFTRSSSLADLYAPIRPGTEIAFIGGIINYALQHDRINRKYMIEYTNGAYLINPEFSFHDGIFSGYDAKNREYDRSSWAYQKDRKGVPRMDVSLRNRNSVYQLLKEHYSRYTPERISSLTGCPEDAFIRIAEIFTSTHKPDRAATIMYSMNEDQHAGESHAIHAFALLQLLMGNIGVAGGGINALKHEANIQGATDHCIHWHSLPGYLPIPETRKHPNLDAYISKTIPSANDPMSINWRKNNWKYMVSLLRAFYGDAANRENDFCYDWLPKVSGAYGNVDVFNNMGDGRHKGAILIGANPLVGCFYNEAAAKSLENLEWLAAVDIFETETSNFWKRSGANPRRIKTEVFLLPSSNSIEREGSVTNAGRWVQWGYKAVSPPDEIRDNLWIVDNLFRKIRGLYERDKGARFPDPILNAYWNFHDDGDAPSPHMVAREINGFDWNTKKPLGDFISLKNDGSTASGNWLYCGSYNDGCNMMARRGMKDGSNRLGMYPEWAWCWPANSRVLYNRAGVNREGDPWNPAKRVASWNGSEWEGDMVHGGEDAAPDMMNPFIMLPEGVGRLFANTMTGGPIPEHYESKWSPSINILSSQNNYPILQIIVNKHVKPDSFPYLATYFRVTEHWRSGAMTKNMPWLSELSPDIFCEISPSLAWEKGIRNRDRVEISSPFGRMSAFALVTGRLQPLRINGRDIEIIGIHSHFALGYGRGRPYYNNINLENNEPIAFLVDINKEE
ncbi:MAG: formate dehydrogenase-N subunit alpha [Spirochaetota bacterium]|nr:formate dehydrogenase-N subunit alpha [Spirochaetota bacterium]